MNIRITQNGVGKYNLLSNEKTLSFYMSIYEDGKVVQIDGVNATAHYSGDEDDAPDFKDALDNLPFVIEKCFEYCGSIISTRNYMGELLVFTKVFSDNYEELCNNRIEEQTKEIKQEIQSLSARLSRLYGYDDISYEANSYLTKKIDMYKKWISNSSLLDMKEDSESYVKEKAKIDGYREKVRYYESFVMKEE